ncbi:hypothetical protein Angca_001623, partial [Angiostrongylus cantonensis]
SMTSFLRRLSVDSDSSKSGELSNRECHEHLSGTTSRRNCLTVGIERVRRRFSLQPCNELHSHLQGIPLGEANIGSLPNLEEV